MLKKFENLWRIILILFLVVILGSIVLFPLITRILSWAIILLGLGISIFLTVQRHRQAQKSGMITFGFMRRAIALDITGLLLTMGVVIFLAGRAGAYAAQAAGTAWGGTAGILAAIVAGLIVGVVVGLPARWLWQKLTKPILAKATQGGISVANN